MQDQWLEKYKREQWGFSYGSIMNAYGQVMVGKVDIIQFKKDAKELYNLSQELVKESLKGEESPEITKVKDFLAKKGLPYNQEQSENDDKLFSS
jgi:hypothetical protein